MNNCIFCSRIVSIIIALLSFQFLLSAENEVDVECNYKERVFQLGNIDAPYRVQCNGKIGYMKEDGGPVSGIRYQAEDCFSREILGPPIWLTPETHPKVFAEELTLIKAKSVLRRMEADANYKMLSFFWI